METQFNFTLWAVYFLNFIEFKNKTAYTVKVESHVESRNTVWKKLFNYSNISLNYKSDDVV